MSAKDDYEAKYKFWAKEGKALPMPKMALPFKFPPQKFNSYSEFNEWKKGMIKKIALHGGVIWTK